MVDNYNLKRDALFDDIMYVYAAVLQSVGATTESEEIDLDLPRGYIAKIHTAQIKITNGLTEGSYIVEAALVNDPDDTETTRIPLNTVKHDVILDLVVDYFFTPTGGVGIGALPSFQAEMKYVDDDLDIIAARNMRFNATEGNDNGDLEVTCYIWYTIEKVKGEGLLNLLDIL